MERLTSDTMGGLCNAPSGICEAHKDCGTCEHLLKIFRRLAQLEKEDEERSPCFCQKCKKGMFKNERYCSHCGFKQEKTAAPEGTGGMD